MSFVLQRRNQCVIDFHPFGILLVTEAEMMLLRSGEALCSLRVLPCQCTAVSAPLCKAGFHFFVTPIQVSLSPGSTNMASELGEGLGISDPIHHLGTELCLLRPLL